MKQVKRALVSVADKTGIVELCKELQVLEIEILSTGGTAKLLSDNDIVVREVSDYTDFPEMMDGRVKTLHPKIHGALLGRCGLDDPIMQHHNIERIDLLIVSLYPFEQVASNPDCTFEEAIENIDIGGPAMLRSAAKNHAAVTVVVDKEDYATVLAELKEHNASIGDKTRFRLAQKAFAHTARYDANVANFLGALDLSKQAVDYPLTYSFQFNKKQALRYGENPHQTAAFYTEPNPATGTLASAKQLQGKPLSYNNIADADAALECALSFAETTCVIVKHANPCGVATDKTVLQAYERAYASDSQSAFGGIIAFNKKLDMATAKAIIDRQFVEVIIAPEVAPECLDITKTKPDLRLLQVGWRESARHQLNMKRIGGGLLVQDQDFATINQRDLKIVTTCKPTEQMFADLLFAWRVVKYVKSNAIVYAKNQQTIGIGAGQMSRVYSTQIAAMKAKDANFQISGSVMASDAFLLFQDNIDAAAAAGIVAVIQPGGSKRDQEVIAAANQHGIAMVLTDMRHFLH